MRIHHIALRVSDVARSAAFYRDVLALAPLEAPRDAVVWFDLDGAVLMLEPAASPRIDVAFDDDAPRIHVLAFTIRHDERERWRSVLVGHGVPIVRETPYSLYFCDPDGHRLAVSHYPERA